MIWKFSLIKGMFSDKISSPMGVRSKTGAAHHFVFCRGGGGDNFKIIMFKDRDYHDYDHKLIFLFQEAVLSVLWHLRAAGHTTLRVNDVTSYGSYQPCQQQPMTSQVMGVINHVNNSLWITVKKTSRQLNVWEWSPKPLLQEAWTMYSYLFRDYQTHFTFPHRREQYLIILYGIGEKHHYCTECTETTDHFSTELPLNTHLVFGVSWKKENVWMCSMWRGFSPSWLPKWTLPRSHWWGVISVCSVWEEVCKAKKSKGTSSYT